MIERIHSWTRITIVLLSTLTLLIFSLLSGFLANNSQIVSAQSQQNELLYTLVWVADFNESSIDETVWNFNIGDGCPNLCGWGNAELQYYRRENAFIEDDNLVIEARKEKYVDPSTGKEYDYTSARLDTIGKLKITPPARIEIRAKLPKGRGLWPALWLLGEEWSLENVKAWPACGEIDLMELIGHEPDVVYGTVHAPFCYGSRGVSSHFRLPAGLDFSQDYHVFGIEWTSNYIVWFVDNQIYHILTRSEFEKRGCVWVFDKSFHLILNIAVGGYWPGKPDESTLFPARMYIDWIKVYRVNQPTYVFIESISDSDNEVLVRSRGFPRATLETIVNGDFSRQIDLTNSPISNPDEWYLTGRLEVVDEEKTKVENGVLNLALKKPGPGVAGIKLGQVVWVFQNTSYVVRVRAWSSREDRLVLRISLPIYPVKVYSETIAELLTKPKYFELRFDNPSWGPNIVEVALLHNGTISDDLILFIDEIEICRVDTCRPIIETTTTLSPNTTYEMPSTMPSSTNASNEVFIPGFNGGLLLGLVVVILGGVTLATLYLATKSKRR